MVLEAAAVLDSLGVGYTVLHGGLSGKERKEVLEKFKHDPACQVFLSTDAGGTGLNLQVADTVVNLELPWNPAVLEQRIARVHRMGQNRPVRVVNLVTRGTIEEKVLRTLETKKGLFAGIFESDADEIPFAAAQQAGFLNGMRELVLDAPPQVESPPAVIAAPLLASASGISASNVVWQGIVQLLESTSAALGDRSTLQQIPEEIRIRIRAATLRISDCLR